MSDPSLSSTPGPHGPKPEAMQHIHHHSLFHPRLQPQGGGQPGSGAAASYQYQPRAHGWHPDGHYYRRWRGPSRLVWFLLGAGTTAWFFSRPPSQSSYQGLGYKHGWACKTGPLPATPDSRPNTQRAVDRAKEPGTDENEQAILREFGSPGLTREETRSQNLASISSALEALDDRHVERMSHWIRRFQ